MTENQLRRRGYQGSVILCKSCGMSQFDNRTRCRKCRKRLQARGITPYQLRKVEAFHGKT